MIDGWFSPKHLVFQGKEHERFGFSDAFEWAKIHWGTVILKNFTILGDAKEWIFGDAQSLKEVGSLIELKALAGSAAFTLSPAQMTEAADAYRRLSEFPLTLTEAVGYAIQHPCPVAGTLSVSDAIEAAQKSQKR